MTQRVSGGEGQLGKWPVEEGKITANLLMPCKKKEKRQFRVHTDNN